MSERRERLLREELERWTYKPGYRLFLPRGSEDVYGGHMFEIRVTMPDSRNPGGTVPLVFKAPLPPAVADHPEDFMAGYMQATTAAFELHERDEWLRRDGQLVHDPHAARQYGLIR